MVVDDQCSHFFSPLSSLPSVAFGCVLSVLPTSFTFLGEQTGESRAVIP